MKALKKKLRQLELSSRPRPKQQRPRAQRPQPTGVTHSPEDISAIVGLTDPFSGEAARARYPDQGSGRTLTFQRRTTTTLTSDAQGEAALAYNPKGNNTCLGSTVAGTVVTWGANWIDAITDLVTSNAYTYRPTSMGVEIVSTLSATNSSGYLVIAKGGPPTPAGTTTFTPNNFTSWEAHPVKNGGEWHATSHPRSANAYSMKLFTDFDGAADPADDTWETIYIYVSGLPATTAALVINVYLNYEFTPVEDSAIAALASPQPVYHPSLQTAVNEVQNQLPGSHRSGKKSVQDLIKREGKKALMKHVLPFALRKARQAIL